MTRSTSKIKIRNSANNPNESKYWEILSSILYPKAVGLDIPNTCRQAWADSRHVQHEGNGEEECGGDCEGQGQGSERRKRRRIRARSATPFCRFEEFRKMPQHDNDKPSVRVSGPYSVSQALARVPRQEDKSKRLCPRDFKVYGTTHCDAYKYIENYVRKDPSEPAALHKFREEYKSKWVAGSFNV